MSTDGLAQSLAVIGVAGRFPGARDLAEFWSNLRNGVESIRTFTEEELVSAGIDAGVVHKANYVRAKPTIEEATEFDAAFFGLSALEASVTDPQHRLLLECAWEALEDAGYDPARFSGRIGVYAGANENSYFLFNVWPHTDLVYRLGGLQARIASDKDYLTTRISYKLDLRGPSVNVQTSCSTSLVAVHLAAQSLLSGECDLALAGGASVCVPLRQGYLHADGGIYSPDGHCRAFDAAGAGTVFGDGVGIVLLKRAAEAFADRDHIYAIVRASAINNDGASKLGYTAPSVEGQTEVIVEALTLAGLTSDSIQYVEAHGTATPLGDPVEVEALSRAFNAGRSGGRSGARCGIGSVKTNIGHANAAAGIAGFLKTVLALHHGFMPASLHFERPNPRIEFDSSPFYVVRDGTDWPRSDSPRRAGVSSFGIGGTNAHVILEEAPMAEFASSLATSELLVLSARTERDLDRMTLRLADALAKTPGLSPGDVAFTLQVGRREFPVRRTVVFASIGDAESALRQPGRHIRTGHVRSKADVVFLFPGQGSQHRGMARGLFDAEPVFRQEIESCAAVLGPSLGIDLESVLLTSAGGDADLRETALAQPALFAVEYALAKQLMHWGLRPRALLGHSLGEYVAAAIAGAVSFEDAARLVATRTQLMQRLPRGAMLAVAAAEEDVRKLLFEDLSIAAVNAPRLVVCSGPVDQVARLEDRLRSDRTACRLLDVSHAFHSPMMDPILAEFSRGTSEIATTEPRIPYLSDLDGEWVSALALRENYWARHLRAPVRFSDGLRRLAALDEPLFVEVGPGRALTQLVRAHGIPADRVVAALPDPSATTVQATAALLEVVAAAWRNGSQIAWEHLHVNPRRRASLPTYPFDRQRYWIEPPSSEQRLNTIPEPIVAASTSDLAPRAPSSGDGARELVVRAFEDVLGVVPGDDEDFFALGGSSLLATQLVARLSNAFGRSVPLSLLFEASTPAALAARLDANVSSPVAAHSVPPSDILLEEGVPSRGTGRSSAPRAFLLTGATGFVGSFVLEELLARTTADVHCLIRADEAMGMRRILEARERYELSGRFDVGRVICVPGDLQRPRLGLADDQYERLSAELDAIFHVGAWVNWVYPYEALKPTNVDGTREVIRLAIDCGGVPVHLLSSTAVFDSAAFSGRAVLFEDDDTRSADGFLTGYAATKWASERLLMAAIERGLPGSIHRPAYAGGHSRTGVCNRDDYLTRLILGCIHIGAAPEVTSNVNVAPVDYVAGAFVELALHPPRDASIFHLTSPTDFVWSNAVRWLRDAGHEIRLVPQNEWLELISRDASDSANPLAPLTSYLTTGTQGAAVAHAPAPLRSFDRRNAERGLGGSVTCPPVDGVALRLVLDYLARGGMLAGSHSSASVPDVPRHTAAETATQSAAPAGSASVRG